LLLTLNIQNWTPIKITSCCSLF